MAAEATRILIVHVDDDADVRAIVKISLVTVGRLDVVQFEGGQEALAALPALNPDLLLLDVMMPNMSGEETLSAARNLPHLSETPMVFMTAKAQSADVAHLLAKGAAAVITKPFDPLTLADQLRQIIAAHQAR